MRNNLDLDALHLVPRDLQPEVAPGISFEERTQLENHFRNLIDFSEEEYLKLVVKPYLIKYLEGYKGFFTSGEGLKSFSASILKESVIKAYVDRINDPDLTEVWENWEFRFMDSVKQFGIL